MADFDDNGSKTNYLNKVICNLKVLRSKTSTNIKKQTLRSRYVISLSHNKKKFLNVNKQANERVRAYNEPNWDQVVVALEAVPRNIFFYFSI